MKLSPQPPQLARQEKAITLRSVAFGVLGVLVVSGFSSFNDNNLQQTLMIGNHFPVGAYFFFLMLALGWNLLWSKLRPSFALSPREMVVVLAMTLVACWPPTSGLFRTFHRQLILPWYYLSNHPEWHKLHVLDSLPTKLFPVPLAPGKLDETVYVGFVNGMAKGQPLGLSQLPLAAWAPALLWWGPFLVLTVACILTLSLVVHRQWAHHEQISYPLATVGGSFLQRTGRHFIADIFRNRLFWWGAVPVFVLHMIRYLAAWFPGYVPPVDLSWDINTGLTGLFPTLKQSGTFNVGAGTLLFTIVGITYFVSSEIGMTMGLTAILLAFVGAQYYLATGTPLATSDMETLRGGAYVGYAAILLYTGRTYYRAVLRKAIGMGKPEQHEKESVLAARIFLLAFAGFVAMLVAMGLDWLVALVYGLMMMLLYLVFSRIICETGIPFMQANWDPAALMVKLLGGSAVGISGIVFTYYMGTILAPDLRECLMPYAATGYKVADDTGVKRSSLLPIAFVAVVISLVVGFLVTFWSLYNYVAE